MPLTQGLQRKRIDYQKTLRDFAKSMVHLKKPERLLKMIIRFVDRDLGLSHTSLMLLEEERDRFIFVDSKGSKRFPAGLVKIDANHALVRWFQEQSRKGRDRDYLDRALLEQCFTSRVKTGRGRNLADREPQAVMEEMDRLRIRLAVPAYYKRRLLGLFLLGEKKNGRRFTRGEISFFQILAQDCSMAIKAAEHHRNLLQQNQELARRVHEIEKLRKKERDTYYEIIRSLAQEVYAKDPHTFGHISHVEKLGLMTAEEMGLGLNDRQKDILSSSLILHDVGKIGIPDHILKKPGRLSDEEWCIMKSHVEKGADILGHLSDFKEVTEIAKAHHENFDGTGYPNGLRGDQIPVMARIVSVVDAFHAIVSTRCYCKGRSVEFAVEELKRCAGTQFDPQVVEAFIRAMRREAKKSGKRKFEPLQGPVERVSERRAPAA